MSFDERADEVRDESDDPILNPIDLDPEGDKVEEPKEYKFPEKHKEALDGMMYLGRLEDEFEFAGHKIVIRSLTTDEILGIGLLLKKYENTAVYNKAYATAVVSTCLVSVDGRYLPVPLGEDTGDGYGHLRLRFNYIKNRWHSYSIDYIFNKFLVLEDEVREVFAGMGKALG